MKSGAIVYDEWKPRDYTATRWQRVVIWVAERLTQMKVIALFKLNNTT